jgi:hypothetical protein
MESSLGGVGVSEGRCGSSLGSMRAQPPVPQHQVGMRGNSHSQLHGVMGTRQREPYLRSRRPHSRTTGDGTCEHRQPPLRGAADMEPGPLGGAQGVPLCRWHKHRPRM